MSDIVSKIMDFEDGQMDDKQTVEFFAELVKSGMAWQLQGSYGRMANNLIQSGFITKTGEVTDWGKERLGEI